MRQYMSLSKAQTQHWPQGATFAEKLWGSEEDLPQTTSFINTIRIDVRGLSWILERQTGRRGWKESEGSQWLVNTLKVQRIFFFFFLWRSDCQTR